MDYIIIKLKKCKWCGSEFIKKHNREEYCSEEHRKYGNQENTRNRVRIYRKKYRSVLNEKEKYGIGTGNLGQHRQIDFENEMYVIKKELRVLQV